MNKEINDDLLQQRIELYMEKNWQNILADIDNRVEKMMNKIIKELFVNSYSSKSTAEKMLQDKLNNVTAQVIDSMEIDKEEIKRLAKKRLENRVKKLKFDIEIQQ